MSLTLLHEISKHIRIGFLKERPRISGEETTPLPSQSAYAFVCAFYGNEPVPAVVRERESTSPLVTVFDDLVRLSMLSSIPSDATTDHVVRENFVQSLLLFKKMAQQLQSSDESIPVQWNPDEWLAAVVQSIKSEVFLFTSIELCKPTVTRSDYSVSGPGQRGFYCDNLARDYSHGTEVEN